MNSSGGTLQTLARHIVLAARPLRTAVTDLENFKRLMYRLGWEVESLPPSYASIGTLVAEALQALEDLEAAEGDLDPARVLALLDKVHDLYSKLGSLQAPSGADSAIFLDEIQERLFELLLVDYLTSAFPNLYYLLVTLGVIVLEHHAATESRPGFLRTHLRYDHLPKLITDPASIPALVYGWGTDNLDTTTLFGHLRQVLDMAGLRVSFDPVGRDLADGYLGTSQSGRELQSQLKLTVLESVVGGTPVEIALALLGLPSEGEQKAGLILQPVIPSSGATDSQITESMTLRLRAGSDLSEVFGIVVRPGDISVRYPFKPGTEPPAAGFGVALDFAPGTPRLLAGRLSATRLQVAGAMLSLDLDQRQGDLELTLGLTLKDLALVLASDEQDGFLRTLFGDADLTIPIPLVVRWSSKTGLSFSGQGGFELSFNPRRKIGPVTVQGIQLSLRGGVQDGRPPEVVTEIGLAFGGQLGPVGFSVEGIGLRFTTVFAEGNAGPVDVEVGFKPPAGIGLVVDAGSVTGGGFLLFDPAANRYAGVLQLELNRLALKAVGVLSTRMPDGSPGFSLVVSIFAEFFQPIQLGLGFTLNGVGGLAGVHRSVSVDVLRAGIRNKTLDAILFPEDPVRDAPRIISDLQTVFPPMRDRHVFGPMGIIGWGSPTIITAEIGVILELPAPLRLIILGQVRCLLPSQDRALVRINCDVLGVVDSGKGELSIDATIYDSYLLQYTLSGDMALRSRWRDEPIFALAIGGLHPRFEPPPGFPALRRIQVSLGTGSNPRINLDAYLALTSNTVQFGARLEVYAAKGGFNISGHLGFDVLIVLSPFSFVADITGGVALRRGSTNIVTLRLELTLSGPTPWHARGKAKFKVLFFSITIGFDVTWGEDRPIELPTVIPQPALLSALADSRNWSASLPPDVDIIVTLRADPLQNGKVRVHSMGALEVRQSVLPLDHRLERFGSGVPAPPDTFRITQVRLNGQEATAAPVEDFFAPAQFEDMSDEEKLSRKSYEKMQAGVRIASDRFGFADLVVTRLKFETQIVDKDRPGHRRIAEPFRRALALALLSAGAGTFAPIASRGLKQFVTPGLKGALRTVEEGYVIAGVDDLGVRQDLVGADGSAVTQAQAVRILRAHLKAHPEERDRLQVVPVYEVQE